MNPELFAMYMLLLSGAIERSYSIEELLDYATSNENDVRIGYQIIMLSLMHKNQHNTDIGSILDLPDIFKDFILKYHV